MADHRRDPVDNERYLDVTFRLIEFTIESQAVAIVFMGTISDDDYDQLSIVFHIAIGKCAEIRRTGRTQTIAPRRPACWHGVAIS